MSEKAVELIQVSKIYEAAVPVKALDEVNLVVERGEFVAVMGPSGSGKTTLLYMIGCMDKPTRGRVLIDGVDVGGLSEKMLAKIRAEKVGFVFQLFNLIPTLNCLENVELPMHIRGRVSGREARARAVRLLEMVGLGDRLSHRPAQLSGGERQRVAIARALANEPTLILADEPTGNLDSRTGREIIDMMGEINETTGQTVIVVTHDSAVARMAGRIVQMRDGRILSEVELLGADQGRASSLEELNKLRREVMMLDLLRSTMDEREYYRRLEVLQSKLRNLEERPD
ncbi:MAG TPA: ABC transporter ATP-binding protein [Candidatus Korarchaeota archaeon]|nr:ABC transporter ATP-binding protein [Candidatus Korarchaeota archaeon]